MFDYPLSHSLTDGRVGCAQCFITTNKAAVNICVREPTHTGACIAVG